MYLVHRMQYWSDVTPNLENTNPEVVFFYYFQMDKNWLVWKKWSQSVYRHLLDYVFLSSADGSSIWTCWIFAFIFSTAPACRNNNKHSVFKIWHIQIHELPRTSIKKFILSRSKQTANYINKIRIRSFIIGCLSWWTRYLLSSAHLGIFWGTWVN